MFKLSNSFAGNGFQSSIQYLIYSFIHCSDPRYPDGWYEDVCSNKKFFSLAAVYFMDIIGLIVAEIKPQSSCNREDGGLLDPIFFDKKVAYILTLGVERNYRRKGVASLLLDNLISYLTTNHMMKESCMAIYLHVLTSNEVAISFYERRQFRKFQYVANYSERMIYKLYFKQLGSYLFITHYMAKTVMVSHMSCILMVVDNNGQCYILFKYTS